MQNKIILITGSTDGIGKACAHKFASAGARLILNGRNPQKLQDLQQDLIDQYSAEVFPLLFDVRDRKAATQAVEYLPTEWQAIDILINNAGLVLGVDKEHEGNLDDWEIVIDTNIKGLLTITRLIVPGMTGRGRGHIINIGSIAGDSAYPGGSVYCATKSAVKALTDGLRIDLVDTPLRVTNIKPGLVETNFSITRFYGDKAKAGAVYKGLKPLTGEDIAETIFFAASAPEHVQIAEVLIMPVNQATATITYKQV
jgi:NADP-dependent 3-hydroxy acid dehydrogenase YdfG